MPRKVRLSQEHKQVISSRMDQLLVQESKEPRVHLLNKHPRYPSLLSTAGFFFFCRVGAAIDTFGMSASVVVELM